MRDKNDTVCKLSPRENVPVGDFGYSAEREESRLTAFSHFCEYLCHTKRYEYIIHIKMILNLY